MIRLTDKCSQFETFMVRIYIVALDLVTRVAGKSGFGRLTLHATMNLESGVAEIKENGS